MKSHVHYEAAFEHYVRQRGIPFVAVDEAKRAAFRDAKLKSFDFILYSETNANWLVDVKGRRFGAASSRRRPSWQNWVTQSDLDGLTQWQEVFGAGFRALLVFAYLLEVAGDPPIDVVHEYGGRRYVFAALPLDDYRRHARVRSPKWGTVNIPVSVFKKYVRPIEHLL